MTVKYFPNTNCMLYFIMFSTEFGSLKLATQSGLFNIFISDFVTNLQMM